MNTFKLKLTNCYGISSLEHEFDFTIGTPTRPKAKAYAIYAPNGLMKTSFAKTFDDLSKGESPKEERYNRPSSHVVQADGNPVQKEILHLLKSEIDISSDSPAITNILVNPENKARYDSLLVDIEEKKAKLINYLQRSSKVKKADVERQILEDWRDQDFPACIRKIRNSIFEENLGSFEYATIFDPKAIEVLKSPEFVSSASDFNARYQELFDQSGTIYQKGVFNPTKAETSFATLTKQGFFAGGHRVHLRGESASIDKDELDRKLEAIHARIDGDENLRKLRNNLAKNAQTQALTELIETLSPSLVEFLLDKVKPQNQGAFRKELWSYLINNSKEAAAYLDSYDASKEEIGCIEALAAVSAPRWIEAVDLFNDRFIDMPFALSISNQTQAALGKENAKLKFTFRDGSDTVEWTRSEVKTLSQGEKRALYLLNFIFEVEARKIGNQETLFVIDDAADSFDYKNKHAILQYLQDLSKTPHFHQIVLTHNYDFFRALARFVPRDRCLMANRQSGGISLTKAEGVNNYFIGKWKNNVTTDEIILCATIPFTRNLIEYTRGMSDPDYLKLTSLLHWKSDTGQILIRDYLDIYNRLFCLNHPVTDTRRLIDLIIQKSDGICAATTHDGLNLENKVLLSISIRLKAEMFMTNKIRGIRNDQGYWCPANGAQFGALIEEYFASAPPRAVVRTLEKVSITVSSNIHLNSFMYEPILDLTVEHLIKLYLEVGQLE